MDRRSVAGMTVSNPRVVGLGSQDPRTVGMAVGNTRVVGLTYEVNSIRPNS
jgi:hypothetical protein